MAGIAARRAFGIGVLVGFIGADREGAIPVREMWLAFVWVSSIQDDMSD